MFCSCLQYLLIQINDVMLIKFSVTNYRGFANRIEWDLSNPANYEFNQNAIKDGIIKNGIIYGPNGSGKSNFSLAIFDIEYHLSPLKAKKNDYYNNYVYAGNADTPVKFEYEFKFGAEIVLYKYSKNKNGELLSEELHTNDTEIFARIGNQFTLNAKFFPNNKQFKENFIHGANNVSVINFLLAFYPLPKDNVLLKLQDFVNNMLWFRGLDIREFIGIETQENRNIEEFIIKNNLISEFEAFLKDTSNQNFTFIQPSKDDRRLWYSVKGIPVSFIDTVSTGTKSLELLFFWINRMGSPSFVFIDEFDAFYHFRLSYNICKLLFKSQCQLFLSSHNTYLMTNELLRPDCNFILNDNKVKPLCECTDKELRFGHNIEKLFRSNTFRI